MLFHLFGGITTPIMLKLFFFGKAIIALAAFGFLKVIIFFMFQTVIPGQLLT